ncbi:hypothetical protein [Bosea massiliensis]|jgi:hypothetical protein|uniref:Uncharacterized protein n=1 Tax=Bosea massiliensis TaxID=151419 RepID=A0ABW0NZ46_9HYPH
MRPSIRVTFEDWCDSAQYWHRNLQCLPPVGSTVVFDTAPKGVRHEITSIEHRIGSEHRIIAYVRQIRFLPEAPATL